jgi:hypothetical protein
MGPTFFLTDPAAGATDIPMNTRTNISWGALFSCHSVLFNTTHFFFCELHNTSETLTTHAHSSL